MFRTGERIISFDDDYGMSAEAISNSLMEPPKIDECNVENNKCVTDAERQSIKRNIANNMTYHVTRQLHEFIRKIAVKGGLDASLAWEVQGYITTNTNVNTQHHQTLVICDTDGHIVHDNTEGNNYCIVGLNNLGDVINARIFAALHDAMFIISNRLRHRTITLEQLLHPIRRETFALLSANRMRMVDVIAGHQYLLDKTHDRLNRAAKHLINAIMLTYTDNNTHTPRCYNRGPICA
jgi:hypothetical protein